MFFSLRTRLFLSYLLLIAISTGLIALALLVALRSNPGIERLDYVRLAEVGRAEVRADPPPDTINLNDLNAYAQRFAAANDVRVVFTERRGQVVVDSAALAGEAPQDDITVLDSTIATIERDRGVVRDSANNIWLFVYSPFGPQTGPRMALLAQPTSPLRFLREYFLSPLLQSACVGVGIAIVLSLLITYSVTRSLRRFSDAAKAVAQGKLDHTVPDDGPVEVQSLAHAFNEMVARVRTSQQAQRDFVSNVSHELKTPLTSIQGFSQAILDNAIDDKARAARIINDEAARMHRLVEGLLDLARMDSGQAALQFSPVDLGHILRSVSEKLDLRAKEKGITLKVDLAPLPVIVADGDRLAQVFTNLLDNALQHTPGGGLVTLAAGADANAGGKTVAVSITDTGAGIPAGDLPRIFERFYRVDKSRAAGRGYGIGLAITREIIQAHGGMIVAESVIGLGTKFTVKLPVSRNTAATLPSRRRI
jgi:two-component system OmpR family sensor kinase